MMLCSRGRGERGMASPPDVTGSWRTQNPSPPFLPLLPQKLLSLLAKIITMMRMMIHFTLPGSV